MFFMPLVEPHAVPGLPSQVLKKGGKSALDS